MAKQYAGEAYPAQEAATSAELAGPIGRVVCTDERTGRDLIITGFNPDTGFPTVHFAPVDVEKVIIPYDQ